MRPAATSMFASLVLPIFLQAASALPTAPVPPEAAPLRVLRLSDAVDTALKNQPTLAESRGQTMAARGRATQARQLYYPQVQLSASYQRVRSASIGGRSGLATTTATGGTGTGTTGTGTTGTTGTPTAIATTDSSGIDIFTFGGSANQLIWDWNNTRNKVRAADRNVESFVANEQATSQAVIAGVRRAFFTARAQKALIRVARESLANFERHLEQVQGFVQVGTRPEIDLAQARTDLSNARLTLINADNGYAIAKAQLAEQVGTADVSDFDVADDELGVVEGEELPTDRLVAKANELRPELKVYEKQREAYDLTAKAYKGAYLPTLSASAGASETGTELGDLGPAWNVGATVGWPIFQGWLTHGQIREAEGNAAAARAQVEGQKLTIRVQVQQAQLGIRAAKASQAAADEAVANARERLRLAEGRYAAGVGSIIELGDAQVALATASAQAVQAQYNLSSARADLLAALGER
ncbi:MAG: outer rane efflux protein [Labilithrix sp.]|nr:outer rane efflux protein [Labilithrix sp.]